jgi:hypothetical protein
LVAITDVYTWKLLRLDFGLSRAETERTLTELIVALQGDLMARYLAYTTPARGHLSPIVPMLGELRDRGHEVIARTLASEVGPLADLGIAAGPNRPRSRRSSTRTGGPEHRSAA